MYLVEGNLAPFQGLPDVMLMVASQGFEPRLIGSEPTVLNIERGGNRLREPRFGLADCLLECTRFGEIRSM